MSTTVQYTSEQRAALTTWSESVALSAGAGCGKTFVLTRRFLSHLDPHDDAPSVKLGELVAITFTDAAARELRDRVRRECIARLTDPANEDPGAWLRLLRSLDQARISTIHSLCSRLIRAHAVELGLDPNFRVCDAAASAVIQIEVLDDVLRERLAKQDDTVMRLATDYGLSMLKTMIGEMLPKVRIAGFDAWRSVSATEIVIKWQEVFHEQRREMLVELAQGPSAITLLQLLRSFDPAQPERFVESRAVLLELIPNLLESDTVEADLQQLHKHARVRGLDRKTICGEKDWLYPQEYAEYRDVCERFRKEIETFQKGEFNPDIAIIAAENGLRLMQISGDVAAAYEPAKREQAAIDYDDLLFHAHRLLSDERFAETRREWQKQVRLLLVDEFQDTDQMQVDIVKALVGDGLASGGLFFVGDFKQSIYRFRGAEPRVFEALTAEVPASGRLLLTTNFRSQPAILDFVNSLFGQVWPEKYRPLVPQRSQVTLRPAVEFLWTEPVEPETAAQGDKPKKNVNMDALRAEEARRIAQRLKAMIADGEPVGAKDGQPRPVKPGDIVILFRALSDVQFYEKALEEAEIDYYLVGGHAFYSQQEVFDVLNLLRAVSSACDDVSLAGVLRSPFFSLADESLFWLVEHHGSLNAAIAAGKPPRELEPAEQVKFSAAVATINELRRMKDVVSPAVLLQTALDRTGYDAVLLAEFLGERKLANLHKLLEQARVTEQVAGGFDEFLEQLTEFTTRAPKEALAATNPESADVVRLMTVHMAKGLEFPVVVIADLDRELQIRWPAATFDPQLGPLVKLPKAQEEPSAVGHDLYQRIHLPEEEDELNRLFYVACTRAADYLVLSAAVKDLDKPTGAWLTRLGQHFDLRTGCLLGAPHDASPLVKLGQIELPRASSKHSTREDLLKIIAETERLVEQGNGEVPRAAMPLAPDRSVRRRFSVTRLSGTIVRHDAHGTDADGPRAELPGAGKWLEPLGFGTLVHAVLERARFGQPNPVRQWCELLAPVHMDEKESDAALEAAELVERFLKSPRCKQLADARYVKREIEFLLRWPLDAKDGKPRFLQGYIDCIYHDAAGDWHLLDFKTNQVAGKNIAEVAEAYGMQLSVYALAMEQSLGTPPAELVLHFLRTGQEHRFPWDEESRTNAIAQIDQAIAAALM